jgi:hypothetical protein
MLDGVISRKIAQLIVISIVMIGYVADRGIRDAVYNIDIDIEKDPRAVPYQIHLPNENQKMIIPLMNIDKGLIYKSKGEIHFAKWSDISEFSRLKVEHNKTILSCELFANLLKYFCQ